MLKADLHIHVKEDIIDDIQYSTKELIDIYSKRGFDVIATACHKKSAYTQELSDYAKSKNILLIKGVEMLVENVEVLLYNFDENATKDIKKISDLMPLKSKDNLIIAPHPFFPKGHSLQEKLIENIDIFDAIEFSQYYSRILNFNKKAILTASRYNKPIVASSDAHKLNDLKRKNYTLIHSKKNIQDIFDAIKTNRIEIVTEPLNDIKIFFKGIWALKSLLFKPKKYKKYLE